jgi:4,5-DOPA dioxygenase extradiol
MPAALPTLFISHGAPDIALRESPAREFLSRLGFELSARYGIPKAILVASAHFGSGAPLLTADEKPATLHDFVGFDRALNHRSYDAPGAPALANRASALLNEAGFRAQPVTRRGFDHGAWSPLSLMFPRADIPISQISVQPGCDGRHHLEIGRALAPLRHERVLILGSGAATHNMRAVFHGGFLPDAPAPDWVEAFVEWLRQRCEAGESAEVADFAAQAPHARENHPTAEHFLPLPLAFGAAGPGAKGERLHTSGQFGVLKMDAYAFH